MVNCEWACNIGPKARDRGRVITIANNVPQVFNIVIQYMPISNLVLQFSCTIKIQVRKVRCFLLPIFIPRCFKANSSAYLELLNFE
jgi:hypothetical protein